MPKIENKKPSAVCDLLDNAAITAAKTFTKKSPTSAKKYVETISVVLPLPLLAYANTYSTSISTALASNGINRLPLFVLGGVSGGGIAITDF